MTIEAVNKFVGRGIISDEFRKMLTARKMTKEDIAAVDRGLDEQDVNAIVLALMNTGSFPRFRAEIDLYINRRYPSGTAASGDGLSIPV